MKKKKNPKYKLECVAHEVKSVHLGNSIHEMLEITKEFLSGRNGTTTLTKEVP